MPVGAIGSDVKRAVLEPFDGDVGIVEARVLDAGEGLDPVDAFGFLAPEFVRLLHALFVELPVSVLVDEGPLLPLLGYLHRIDFIRLMLGHSSVPPNANAALFWGYYDWAPLERKDY